MCPLTVFLVTSGGGEAGAGCRVGLPHREGEAGGPELLSHPEPHPSIHLWGPGLEGILLVNGARRRPGWGEWAQGRKTYVQKAYLTHFEPFLAECVVSYETHEWSVTTILPQAHEASQTFTHSSETTDDQGKWFPHSSSQEVQFSSFLVESRKCNAVRSFQLYWVCVHTFDFIPFLSKNGRQ